MFYISSLVKSRGKELFPLIQNDGTAQTMVSRTARINLWKFVHLDSRHLFWGNLAQYW